MSRSVDAIHRSLLAKVPPGWVMPRAPDTVLAAVLYPVAVEIADVEAKAEAMMAEVDPRTATLCLPDFERVLGPDPCGRDLSTLTTTQRQQLAFQRWTARGGASIPYFVALAAKRGVTITITENRVSYAGEFEAGGELIDQPQQFIWTVHLALSGEVLFEAGGGEAGERLYDITLSDIECDIRRLKPSHTDVVFQYEAA